MLFSKDDAVPGAFSIGNQEKVGNLRVGLASPFPAPVPEMELSQQTPLVGRESAQCLLIDADTK